MLRNSLFLLVFALIGVATMSSRAGTSGSQHLPDLSTPQSSFSEFLTALQDQNQELLNLVATPTGLSSLIVLEEMDGYQEGMPLLAKELRASQVQWDQITDDIYFVSATLDGKTHKMEFTLEEPGWMLYHWQLGGGVDLH